LLGIEAQKITVREKNISHGPAVIRSQFIPLINMKFLSVARDKTIQTNVAGSYSDGFDTATVQSIAANAPSPCLTKKSLEFFPTVRESFLHVTEAPDDLVIIAGIQREFRWLHRGAREKGGLK
jgi:hypothetical protein